MAVNTNRNALSMVFLSRMILLNYLLDNMRIYIVALVFVRLKWQVLKEDINEKILHDEYDEHCTVKVTDVISRLKLGKRDGHTGLTTDHVNHACDEWFVHVSMLFSALIVHSNITDDLSVTTILHIPKGKNLNYSIILRITDESL